ncbi:hypothetical protein Aeqsu_0753 [Aequorivita sublithincola DSM 14238]|uniref:Secretion system C-terminal sorting domain-containing protein n=1 Tax=Aequorivita sublithincola (strain DSM 14238 / LMG 21431 / ACAM 643 / 9-3) TaxID=746697 RepID=I3YTE2_AEQSU|nr:T9SS type A sorting domain-containing protein [Aequorivita sublithincola]AFL80260.1 hypothetical protein Aeqsu_0753 [Aequorivita sublithincola DSM 14238]
MKRNLLFASALLTVSLAFSQNFGTYETDQNGKLFYHSDSKQSVLEQEHKAPTTLALDWSNPDFDVSNNPTQDSWDPRLAVSGNGTAYVVYSDNYSNGLQKIMFRKKVPGQDWSAKMFVDKGGEIGGRNNHYGAIAVSPNGDLHVSYNVWAFENVRNYVAYSYYNAAADTWSDGLKISDAGGTVNHTFGRHDIYSTDANWPVVVWSYDNRENMVNEEIYMKYFDGTLWSADIPVSDITDSKDAGFPFIRSIGNNKAMLLFSEKNAANVYELKYRIYDETTHDLSPSKIATSDFIGTYNFTLVHAPTGETMILTVHREEGPVRDVFNVYDYDEVADSFTLSANKYEAIASTAGLKRIDMDCNMDGDCAVVYTDVFAETNSFMEYDKTTGFGTPEIINTEDPVLEEINCRFDDNGNLHVTWNDKRFDDGQSWDEREVFYEKGINTLVGINTVSTINIAVYPNPSNGKFTVQTNDSLNLEIFDLLGRSIASETISGTTEVNKNLPQGTYLLRFSNEKSVQVKKLIVE